MVKCIKANNNTYLIAYKENSEKKGLKSATFPKILSWADKHMYVIQDFFVDCDTAGNTSAHAAKGIKHSLDKFQIMINI